MSEQSAKNLDNLEDTITNYYIESIASDNKNNTITPTIKKIEFKNNNKDINCRTLTERSSNYLKNLEIFKNLPDSIVTNILKSRKYISHNHNILFHHFSKEKKISKKNTGKIQSIIINANLKTLKKENNSTRALSKNSNSNIIYYKKNLMKSKSNINTNRQSKKNNNTSQSSIIANYETNYDYDFDNNNDNYINFNDNSEKINLLEKKNCFTDVSLKEYLCKETKPLRTAFNYFENNEKDKNKEKKVVKNIKIDISETKNDIKKKNIENSIIDIKIKENKNRIRKYSFSKINTNSNINNTSSGKNKIKEIKNTYTNRYKIQSNKIKLNFGNNNKTHFNQLLTKKSYNYLCSNGNFTTANSKRQSFIKKEEEKNNSKKKNFNNIFLNTQKFYNDSKIDYISFRKNNLNNSIFSNQNNRNFLKRKEEKRIPCKLIKKDLSNCSSNSKKILTKKYNSFSKRNLSMENGINKKGKHKFIANSERRINIQKIEKTFKKGKLKEKIENNKKKIFKYKNEY